MNPKDFQIKKKTFVVSFTRPVSINDTASELTVDISLNNLKGLFTIKPKINFNQVTGDAELDGATIETVGDLIEEAIKYALAWRSEWEESRSNDNPAQIKIGFDASDDDDEVIGERAEKRAGAKAGKRK